MKAFQHRLLSLSFLAVLACLFAGEAAAQTFQVLHSFAWTRYGINYEGADPWDRLTVSGGVLYGTAEGGGTNGYGTVFKLNTNGTGFTTLHNFTDGSDSGNPEAGLVLSGTTLYGTTYLGGSAGYGTVFKLSTSGTGFTTLHQFSGSTDGASPSADLILSSSTLYGTCQYGGTGGLGTVFKLGTGGGSLTVLHSFAPVTGAGDTNGASAGTGDLLLSGSSLIGVQCGWTGMVFSVTTAGTGFSTLLGYGPQDSGVKAGLVLSGSFLYWVSNGAPGQVGASLVAMSTNGTGFTKLHTFSRADGINPSGLVLSGNTLYGAASEGGSAGNGTVFAINTDGTGFTNLHNFTAMDPLLGTNNDGALPLGGLTLSGNTLYGTASAGGIYGNGTIFTITLPVVQPQLTITPLGTNVVLSWPTTPVGFTLQSTTDLTPPVVWAAVSPPPVLVNGQNTVTNPISAAQQFFRLSQ